MSICKEKSEDFDFSQEETGFPLLETKHGSHETFSPVPNKALHKDFFLVLRIDLLQKAFINPPEPRGALFYDGWKHFILLQNLEPNSLPL